MDNPYLPEATFSTGVKEFNETAGKLEKLLKRDSAFQELKKELKDLDEEFSNIDLSSFQNTDSNLAYSIGVVRGVFNSILGRYVYEKDAE